MRVTIRDLASLRACAQRGIEIAKKNMNHVLEVKGDEKYYEHFRGEKDANEAMLVAIDQVIDEAAARRE